MLVVTKIIMKLNLNHTRRLQNMIEKINWKAMFAVMLILVICLGFALYLKATDTTYNFGDGFEVKKSEVDSISDKVTGPFYMCSTDNGRCVSFTKIDDN